MVWVPLALACGHLVQEMAEFEYVPGEPSTVRCPECLTFQTYVIEPGHGFPLCLCAPGGHHTCGQVTTVEIDLGEIG